MLAWTVYQDAVTHVLCGARNSTQANENAQAGKLKLDSGDLETIDRLLVAAKIDLPHPFHS